MVKIETADAGESYTYTYGPFDNPDEEEIVLGRGIDGHGTRILGILVDKDDACFGWVTTETEPGSQAIADSYRVVALDTHVEQVRNMFTT